MEIHSIRFGHNWATWHTGTQPRTTSGLIPKLFHCCSCMVRSQQWKAIHCGHSGTWAEGSILTHASERQGQRTKGLSHSVQVSASDTHHFCSFNWPKQMMWSPQGIPVSPLRVWMFVNGYHILIDFNLLISSVSMKWWLVIFICMSLIITEVGHIFRCFLSVCVYSFENCLFYPLPTFLLSFSNLILQHIFIVWLLILYWLYLPDCGIAFHFV